MLESDSAVVPDTEEKIGQLKARKQTTEQVLEACATISISSWLALPMGWRENYDCWNRCDATARISTEETHTTLVEEAAEVPCQTIKSKQALPFPCLHLPGKDTA